MVAGDAAAEIFRRAQAREGAEVMVEMRLIEVSADVCNLCPVNITEGFNPSQHVVESAHAAEALRREPDLVPEQLNKASPDIPLDARPLESSVKTTSSVGTGITCSRW